MKQPSTSSLTASRTLVVLITILIFVGRAPAETVLYQFNPNGGDGILPLAGLVNRHGSLYGTTSSGGQYLWGTVFQLTPPSTQGGPWTETVLYSFRGPQLGDGGEPKAGLIFDDEGSLYGTTNLGGTENVGTIFQLVPPTPPNTNWTETILYNFSGAPPSAYHPLGLTVGLHGALYGITQNGMYGGGAVFRLRKLSSGSWIFDVLYNFGLNADGRSPQAGLIADNAGNLYGTTSLGGSDDVGTVFELSPTPSGSWTETVLYSFVGGNDGSKPFSNLVLDQAGNLFGTTYIGGTGSCPGCGTVFELSPPAPGGAWTETVLYSFAGGGDGQFPLAGLLLDDAGSLYGTTSLGGAITSRCLSGCGTVFKLSPPGNPGGAWTETRVHQFGTGSGGADDGANPGTSLIFGPKGAVYGTTPSGIGASVLGTVFGIRP